MQEQQSVQSTSSNTTHSFSDKKPNKFISTNHSKKFKFWPKSKKKQILLILFLIVCMLLGLFGVLVAQTYRTGKILIKETQEMAWLANQAKEQFGAQNLPETENNILLAQEKLTSINNHYSQLAIYKNFPWVKNYYNDGSSLLIAANHGLNTAVIAVKAITPYADVLGFQGEGSFEGGTTEDRVGVLLQTLEMVAPQLDQIESELKLVEQNIMQINADLYPEQINGKIIRQNITQAQQMTSQTINIFSQFRPVIEQLPNIAGSNSERKKYLVLFQNNNELRPTGGFLTAYSIINIENGKVQPEKSDDIYELDKKFNERIAIPESLGRYLTTERYWNLRDMNISPDFKVSMDTFFEHYMQIKGEPKDIDGIIVVDTFVLTRLLEVLGPVEVPGYGTFSAQNDPRCDCPQVVYALSEIITKPTPYLRDDRKGILGPMMQAILQKTYGAPKQHWPQLFSLIWESIQGRNIQMYFLDETAQLAAENANAAGRLIPPQDTDFFGIVDANLGGAKSNLFTEYEVKQVVEGPSDGFIKNSIEITYKNTRKADNCNLEAGQLCLNAPAPTWHRLYLPKGTQIIETQGFTQEPNLYEELGFQVIDGFFRLDPLGMTKIRISYQVPYTFDEYRLTVWKQGGVKPFNVLIDVNGNEAEILVNKDTLYQDSF